ncbi:ribosomal protein S12 methylthiotransferase RimO [Candidatus Magnetoovum chiemensis]|nr:ribosomal protein S12 methylthiotransferase RimO [Candidatus Magnetoovum chiemensis]
MPSNAPDTPPTVAPTAALILINTCGFIEDAKKESIEEILNLAQYKGSSRKLGIFGCLSQRYKEELKKGLPEIDAVWGVDESYAILEYAKTTLSCDTSKTPTPLPDNKPNMPLYAYIKIAEGCNRTCSFCVIPSIRGKFRSSQPDDVLNDAQKAVKEGKKELILVAQDITSYGADIGYSLSRLIKDIASISGDFWIRLLYLYPTAITDTLIDTIKSVDKVCKYLDIPIQHSETKILKAMRRGASREFFLDLVNNLRSEIKAVTLRTTVITGFPGETRNDFHGLLSFIEDAQFDRLGAFTYSDEEETCAFALKPKVSAIVKKRRLSELMAAQAKISFEKNKSLKGLTFRCLIDEINDDTALGRLYSHAPEIDGNVIIEGRLNELPYDFINVEITENYEYDIVGKV